MGKIRAEIKASKYNKIKLIILLFEVYIESAYFRKSPVMWTRKETIGI